MIMKCERCNKPATIHLTEIQGGKKIEKHLCEACAAAARSLYPIWVTQKTTTDAS